jgi:hypothetical protein
VRNLELGFRNVLSGSGRLKPILLRARWTRTDEQQHARDGNEQRDAHDGDYGEAGVDVK